MATWQKWDRILERERQGGGREGGRERERGRERTRIIRKQLAGHQRCFDALKNLVLQTSVPTAFAERLKVPHRERETSFGNSVHNENSPRRLRVTLYYSTRFLPVIAGCDLCAA